MSLVLARDPSGPHVSQITCGTRSSLVSYRLLLGSALDQPGLEAGGMKAERHEFSASESVSERKLQFILCGAHRDLLVAECAAFPDALIDQDSLRRQPWQLAAIKLLPAPSMSFRLVHPSPCAVTVPRGQQATCQPQGAQKAGHLCSLRWTSRPRTFRSLEGAFRLLDNPGVRRRSSAEKWQRSPGMPGRRRQGVTR